MNVSQKLKIIAQLTGFTQEKLARELEVSFPTLNSWINLRSTPHKKAQEKIDRLYRKYTGQEVIPKEALVAKKRILMERSKKHKRPLQLLLSRPDLYDEFVLALTYHSNSIEGSTLSENETADILFRNRSIPKKSLIEHLEAKNHQAAFSHLINHLSRKGKMDEDLILKLHSILMNGIRDDAGLYRRHGVRIVGTNVPTANYMKIAVLMKEMEAAILKKRRDGIAHVSKVHADFEKIHPFSDGNGRVERLLMTGMLLKNNLPPAIVLQEKKRLYYTCLQKAQTEGDYSFLEDFIGDAVLEGFRRIDFGD